MLCIINDPTGEISRGLWNFWCVPEVRWSSRTCENGSLEWTRLCKPCSYEPRKAMEELWNDFLCSNTRWKHIYVMYQKMNLYAFCQIEIDSRSFFLIFRFWIFKRKIHIKCHSGSILDDNCVKWLKCVYNV